jgi:hypothetical protein
MRMQRVTAWVGASVAEALGLADGEPGAPAPSPCPNLETATAPNARTISPMRAAWVSARSSGQRVVGIVKRGRSRTTAAVRATGRREASATATAVGSRPGARIAARPARAARNAAQAP